MEKYCRLGRSIDVHVCAMHAGNLRLHTHTHIHSEYVILNDFPLQQWLNELPKCYFICTLPGQCEVSRNGSYVT